MIELFRQWLISVIATTLLIAVVEVLMPSGSVKEVGKLVCGMLLLLTIVRPIASLSSPSLADLGQSWRGDFMVEVSDMENYYNHQIKTIIEQELAAYILDKATEENKPESIWVDTILGEDGLFLPVKVELVGVSQQEEAFFRRLIGQDLGVEQVIFKEVEDENME